MLYRHQNRLRHTRHIFYLFILAGIVTALPVTSQAGDHGYRIETVIGKQISDQSSITHYQFSIGKNISAGWLLNIGVDLSHTDSERTSNGDVTYQVDYSINLTREYSPESNYLAVHLAFRHLLVERSKLKISGGITPYFYTNLARYHQINKYVTRDFTDGVRAIYIDRNTYDGESSQFGTGVRFELEAAFPILPSVDLVSRYSIHAVYTWQKSEYKPTQESYFNIIQNPSYRWESNYRTESFNFGPDAVWLGLAFTF